MSPLPPSVRPATTSIGDGNSTLLAERISNLAIETFTALPAKSKPRIYPNGTREWTPMSAVVLSAPITSPTTSRSEISGLSPSTDHREGGEETLEQLTVISLATGTKCLPSSALPLCHGTVLHDSHAEVLALRAFNRWVLGEMEMLFRRVPTEGSGGESRFVEFVGHDDDSGNVEPGDWEARKPFRFRRGVRIYLFSTEAPCGDASMGLLQAATERVHGSGEAWTWSESTTAVTEASTERDQVQQDSPLQGRGYFSRLGLTRRKPSRADAEPTLSKSCSDKLAVRQVSGVVGWPASLFLRRTENGFLRAMVLPVERWEEEGFARAFGARGRLGELAVGGDMHHFDVRTVPAGMARFAFEKLHAPGEDGSVASMKAGNVSAVWVRGQDGQESLLNETLVNGVKQGAKQFSEKSFKMSAVCRRRMWEQGRRLMELLKKRVVDSALDEEYLALLEHTLGAATYNKAKMGALDRERGETKEHAAAALGGWRRNDGDGDWGL